MRVSWGRGAYALPGCDLAVGALEARDECQARVLPFPLFAG